LIKTAGGTQRDDVETAVELVNLAVGLFVGIVREPVRVGPFAGGAGAQAQDEQRRDRPAAAR